MSDTAVIIKKVRSEGRTVLTEIEAKQVIREAGIKITETRLAAGTEEALAVAGEIGYPVALKISSPDITHKSDAGGVKTDLWDAADVAKACTEILASVKEKYPQAKIDGVTVQPMAGPGVEVIIGAFKDPQFGPVIMFGLGGIFVEVLKDVAFRLIPLEKRDAAEMIEEIKGKALLRGYRGQEPADIPSLIDIMLKVSTLMENIPEIKELDLNPVFAGKDSAVAADARMVLEG